ncbi:hypothetical protein M4D54_04795 [Brachybacterium sp. p3-SID1565]|uniref:AI-2E family transporter n=1 Tax=Brachybacterium epidermidis TaxID=2781983 RepID=A0ABR9VWX4_9MICO|nr:MULTISPECIES: hypothetical protein [Brachybacterium]MBE9402680.1 hypothetical protein [Brachybacterium epidermidis]MCT1384949.1 hypothetical protein [Brachybacterium sp. p3-SID1565]
MSSDEKKPQGGARDESTTGTRQRRLLGALSFALLAAWLLMLAPLPYSLLSGLAGLIALVLLIPLIVTAFREGRRGMAIFSAVVGVPATLLIVLGTVTSLVFYGPTVQREECVRTAITERAKSQCAQEAQESMTDWITGLLGG